MIPIKFFQLRFIACQRLKKQGSVTYSAVQKNEVSKLFTISLSSNRGETFQVKQTLEFSRSQRNTAN